MEFTLLASGEPSNRPMILYDFFNSNNPPIEEDVPISNGNDTLVFDHEHQPAADCSLELTLSCPGSTIASSSSSSSSNGSKRKATLTHDRPQTSSAKRSKNTVILDREATLTELRLGPCNGDEFEIKKTLETSDVNSLSKLTLCKEAVEKHMLAYWDEDKRERLSHKNGVAVKVLDSDMGYETDLTMKIWRRNKTMVLNGKWINDFVKRREWKKGDQIGLYWDQSNSRLVFSVLHRAPPTDQQQQQLDDLPIPIEATPIRYCMPN